MTTTRTRHFLIKRSELSTLKMFVEFYQPEDQELLRRLREGAYHARPLVEISGRLFDGPFGSDRKIDMYQSSGIPYIRVKDVLPEGIDRRELVYISQEKHAEFDRSRVVTGNVLMTIAGRVGTAAVFPNDLAEGNITGHIVGIDLPETINPHYVAAFINSELGQFQVDRWAQRTTRPELNLFEVGQILIPLPPRPVQDRIAQVMQDAYAARQVKLVEAEALLKDIESLVLEMLEIPADLPKDEKHFTVKRSLLHRSDVRYFSPYYQQIEQHIQSGKFATQPLRTLCTKLTNGLTPARAAYEDEGHIVVKVASLTKDWRIDWNKIAFTSEAFFDKAKRASIEQDDLLILSASHQLDYIGRNFGLVLDIPKSIQGRCIAVGELIIARLNKQKVLPKYILACFVTRPFQELINRMTRGQSAHLYSEDLGSLQIPIPPNSVQKRIANEIDSRCAAARHLRAEAEGIVAEAKAHVERMILGEEPAL